jgi:hypothetical protein
MNDSKLRVRDMDIPAMLGTATDKLRALDVRNWNLPSLVDFSIEQRKI